MERWELAALYLGVLSGVSAFALLMFARRIFLNSRRRTYRGPIDYTMLE